MAGQTSWSGLAATRSELAVRMIRAAALGIAATIVIALFCLTWSLIADRGSAEQRNALLGAELGKLRNDLGVRDGREVIAQNQLKEAQHLYTDCQASYKSLSTTSDTLRSQAEALKQKIDLLEKQIRQRDITIQKLLQPINGDIPAAVAGANVAVAAGAQASLLQQTGCVQWSVMPDKNSVNGVRELRYSTLMDCQEHCINLPACVAVDFDIHTKPTPSCWVHTKMADLDFENTYSQIGTTQYRISRICNPNALLLSGKQDQPANSAQPISVTSFVQPKL